MFPKVAIVFSFVGDARLLSNIANDAIQEFVDALIQRNIVTGEIYQRAKLIRWTGFADTWEIYPKVRSAVEARIDDSDSEAIADRLEAFLLTRVQALGGTTQRVKRPARRTTTEPRAR